MNISYWRLLIYIMPVYLIGLGLMLAPISNPLVGHLGAILTGLSIGVLIIKNLFDKRRRHKILKDNRCGGTK